MYYSFKVYFCFVDNSLVSQDAAVNLTCKIRGIFILRLKHTLDHSE